MIASPAYILDRGWNARAWNGYAERLFTGWLDRSDAPNLLRFIFLEPAARQLIHGWETRARRVAAEFRATSGLHIHDLALRELIEALHRESPEFARFWDEHDVLGREGGERTFNHPEDGFLRYTQVSFTLASHPDFSLTVLMPDNGIAA